MLERGRTRSWGTGNCQGFSVKSNKRVAFFFKKEYLYCYKYIYSKYTYSEYTWLKTAEWAGTSSLGTGTLPGMDEASGSMLSVGGKKEGINRMNKRL